MILDNDLIKTEVVHKESFYSNDGREQRASESEVEMGHNKTANEK